MIYFRFSLKNPNQSKSTDHKFSHPNLYEPFSSKKAQGIISVRYRVQNTHPPRAKTDG